MSVRYRIVTCLAGVGLFAAGCHHNPPDNSQQTRVAAHSSAATQPSMASRSTAADENPVIIESPATADSVAQKARAYASQMEKLMNDPAHTSAARPPATQPAAGKSAVKWTEPQASADRTPREKEVAASYVAIPRETQAVPNANLVLGSSVGSDAARHEDTPPPQVASAIPAPRLIEPSIKPTVSAPAVSTDDLANRLSQHVKDYPQDVAGQLEYQLLQFSRGESVPDLQKLAGLPAEDRELLAAVLDGLSNFRSTLRNDNNMLLSRKIQPLLDVADRLRTQAELTVPVVALCTRVDGYGKYDPIQPLRFAAGVDNEVIVYCEVENFASQLNGQKMWEAALRQEIVVYSDQGMQVWTPDKTAPRPSVDRSRTRHHDFFLGRKVHLPANLSIGRYILKVSVVDQQVNRVAENTVAFEIVAQ